MAASVCMLYCCIVTLSASFTWQVWWVCRLNSWCRWSAILEDFPVFSWVMTTMTTTSRNSVVRLPGYCTALISGHSACPGLNSSSWLNKHCRLWVLVCLSVTPLLNFLHTHTHTNTPPPPFYGSLDFVWDNPGELVPEGTFRHLLDFLEQNDDNTDRCTNNVDGLPVCHLIQTNWCPHLCRPHHFYAGCPSLHNPPNLSWLGTGTKYSGLHIRWPGLIIENMIDRTCKVAWM